MTFNEYISRVDNPKAQATIVAIYPIGAFWIFLTEKAFNFDNSTPYVEALSTLTTIITLLFWVWSFGATIYMALKIIYHVVVFDIRNCTFSLALLLTSCMVGALIVNLFAK